MNHEVIAQPMDPNIYNANTINAKKLGLSNDISHLYAWIGVVGQTVQQYNHIH